MTAGISSDPSSSDSANKPSPLFALIVLILVPIGALLACYCVYRSKWNKPPRRSTPASAGEPEDADV